MTSGVACAGAQFWQGAGSITIACKTGVITELVDWGITTPNEGSH